MISPLSRLTSYLLLAVSGSGLCATEALKGRVEPDLYKNEVICVMSPAQLPARLEDVVVDLASGPTVSRFAKDFGDPLTARFLIDRRLPRAALNDLKGDDPDYKLQNSVVLQYVDDDTTSRALMVLARLDTASACGRNVLGHFSLDPLVAIGSDPAKYQWGLYAVNAPNVWPKISGSAYIGVLDNGIKTSGGIHEDLAGNYRPQFSYNFGYLNNGANGSPTSSANLDEGPFAAFPLAGHGTHTAGLIASRADNGLGGGGVCPSCALASGRISEAVQLSPGLWTVRPNFGYVASGISDFSNRGMQVINNSFGSAQETCQTQPALCEALASAASHDVVVVAASGNGKTSIIDFPANVLSSVIAVGGTTSAGQFWDGGTGALGSNWSNNVLVQQFVAPAAGVISSVYPSYDWIPSSCGDNTPSSFAPGYGDCTGTSMAAPHLAGVVGLMRSADPLKSRTEIRNILAATSNVAICGSASQCELGIPDATAATLAALGGTNVVNRTTPLFAFYSTGSQDHFYTSVPQMAMASLNLGALRPQPSNGTQISFQPIGASVGQYPAFPVTTCSPTPCSSAPKAMALVFTSRANPFGGLDLVPIYRMSYRCGDELSTSPPSSPNPACSTNPSHVSHFYATDEYAVRVYTGYYVNGVRDLANPGIGYKLDGIEGFIHSPLGSQPATMYKLCRKYDYSRDDYVLFPGGGVNHTDCSATTDGYSGGNYTGTALGSDFIGWIYAATNTLGIVPANARPTVSISSPANGASFFAGANVNVVASPADSDGTISQVRFFLGQKLLGISTSSPWTTVWTGVTPGNYQLSALTVDNNGAVGSSSSINVQINALPTIPNGDFGLPNIGPFGYIYNPSGASWTFTAAGGAGGSGVSGSSSAFTSMNPPAPNGQLGFVQGATSISQSIAFGTAGVYRLRFYAAQRYGNFHYLQLQIYVDGVGYGLITPVSTSYQYYYSNSFNVGAGSHTISFVGVNPYLDDNTILIDEVQVISP